MKYGRKITMLQKFAKDVATEQVSFRHFDQPAGNSISRCHLQGSKRAKNFKASRNIFSKVSQSNRAKNPKEEDNNDFLFRIFHYFLGTL